MEYRHSIGHAEVIAAMAIIGVLASCSSHANGGASPPSLLTLVDRSVTQDQGSWVINYRLRNGASTGVIITPEELGLQVRGWVSNSRVASHALPRWSSLVIVPRVDPTAFCEMINAVDESQRCREHIAVSVWRQRQFTHDSGSSKNSADIPAVVSSRAGGLSLTPLSIISLGPGDMMHLRLRIEHQHILYGDYDPLLGLRTIQITLSGSILRDVLPLDREQYLAQPNYTWPEPPPERRDTRHFISAPDSLYIEADVQGHQSYRYQERPVRYNTQMKLRFWYLIAAGTEGECRVRLGQNKDTPLAWRQLHEAAFEERLKTIGRWTKYERIVQIEPEATRLILEFKIVGEIDVGEMWIDDVSLEPLGITSVGGP